MKRSSLWVLSVVVILLIIGSGHPVYAQGESSVEVTVNENPVVQRGDNTWNLAFNEPGALVEYEGTFYLFVNAIPSWPAPMQFGIVTSTDGDTWTTLPEEPLFTAADIELTPFTASISSVIIEDDGTWVAYFYWLERASWPIGFGGIGRATAPDATGPWTVESEPILRPGESGDWDDAQVSYPQVIKNDDGYRMYYTGFRQRTGEPAVGLAFSDDGISWTKYDNPDTVDNGLSNSDYIFIARSRRFDVRIPRVWLQEDGTWQMSLWSPQGLRLASSTDGIAWEAIGDDPYLRPAEFGQTIIGYSSLFPLEDGTIMLMLETGTGNGTDIVQGMITNLN